MTTRFRLMLCMVTSLLFTIPTANAAPPPKEDTVALKAQPGTELDATARKLVAGDLKRAGRANEVPLLLVAEAQLGGPKDRAAIFIQLQSARECGSAGCNTTVYLFRDKSWTRVLDSVTGPIKVDPARHGGLHDLIVDRTTRWIWNGHAYVSTRPGPAVDLRPTHKGSASPTRPSPR